MTPHLTLVLGGASSGKSDWAETFVSSFYKPRVYIATSQAFDKEMDAKIETHRAKRGVDWQTIEAPDQLAQALNGVHKGHAVLVDCATMWLSNRLLADADVEAEFDALLNALTNCASPVVLVSNETGQGIVPENPLARRFRDLQGHLNRRVAEQADLVVAVMAGLPLVLKGQIPGNQP